MPDTRLGFSSTGLALPLALLTGGVVLVLLGQMSSLPVLWQIGVRNMVRRPSQMCLTLLGLVLATAFMTNALVVQDSFRDSQLQYQVALTGNVDETVAGPFTQDQLTNDLGQIQQNPDIQAATGIVIIQGTQLPLTSLRTGATIAAWNTLYAVLPAFDQVYGPITDVQGRAVRFSALDQSGIFLSASVAEQNDVRVGDALQLSVEGHTVTRVVRALLAHDLQLVPGGQTSLVVSLASLQPSSTSAGGQAIVPNAICIKNQGQGGLDDSGPNGSRSKQVTDFLQQAQTAGAAGDFQFQVTDLDDPQQVQLLTHNATLRHDFAVISVQHALLPPDVPPQPTTIDLPGQQPQLTNDGPTVVDHAFLASTSLPLMARAQGFASDRQVWDAVKDHPDYAVMRFDMNIAGLPTGSGFLPFPATIRDGQGHPHQVTVIGLVPLSGGLALYLSEATAGRIQSLMTPPFTAMHTPHNTWLFRVAPGVREAQAERDLTAFLNTDLQVGQQEIYVAALDAPQSDVYMATLTVLMGSYLVIGLLFGAFALSVIVSRAVMERRQQIGMLRALGFPRRLVLGSFLVESSFLITVSLLIGAVLALWMVVQAVYLSYATWVIPIAPVLLLLLGASLVALLATTLPTRRAARVPPAEALRYE
jgi:ABC-type lipoprotein release transport system permease subunit